MDHLLIVAAHPDDETIGASAWFDAAHHVDVLHVTDGAPRDPRWRTAPGDRRCYARIRRRELARALARVPTVATAALALPIADLEACFALVPLAVALARHFERRRYDAIVTHAYEGGHPDHDATAFAVAAARRITHRAPPVFEMALYHGAGGALRAGDFVDDTAPSCGGAAGRERVPAVDNTAPSCGGAAERGPVVRRALTPMQRARRGAMLACFASQRATLAPFVPLTHECFRPAPAYDFTRPPHPGPLYYEQLGLPVSGETWRAQAARAARALAR